MVVWGCSGTLSFINSFVLLKFSNRFQIHSTEKLIFFLGSPEGFTISVKFERRLQ